MNFIQLDYFRKVVELGSVTKAARDLFVTQPAVSKQLRLLEEERRVRQPGQSAEEFFQFDGAAV